MKHFWNWLLSSMLMLLLAACGGGGGSAGTPGGSANPGNFVVNAPPQLTLAIGQKASFPISGGRTPYVASSSAPSIASASIDDAGLSITGIRAGDATVRVAPTGGGAEFSITVSVITSASPFVVQAPDSITLNTGNSGSYTLLGGVAPYKVTTSNSSIVTADVIGSQLKLTGIRKGDATILVYDAVSPAPVSKSVAVVEATPFYTDAPTLGLTLAKDVTRTFVIGGGVAPYSVVSNNTNIVDASVGGSTLSLVGRNGGTATVFLRDSAGSVINIPVTAGLAVPLFTTAPATGLVLGIGNTRTFEVGGGVGPYKAVSNNTSVVSTELSGSILSVSGNSTGSATITIRDAAGASVDITSISVRSVGTFYTNAPKTGLVLGLGSQKQFEIGGGVGPYTVVSDNATVVTAGVTSSVLTLSPQGVGVANVILRDAAGTEITLLNVTVRASTAFFTTAPSSLNLSIGERVSFTVGGGVSPYTVVSNNTFVTTATVSGSTLSIIGNGTGSGTVTLRDAAGGSSNIQVTVGASTALLTTAPLDLTMDGGTTRDFEVSGGSGYSAVSSNTSVVAVSLTTTNTNGIAIGKLALTAQSNGTATVKVNDSTGRSITINVTVVRGAVVGINSIDMTTDKASLQSAGEEATITAFVKNASNVAMADVPISFSSTSGTLLSASATTNAAGIATVKLSPGSDKSNRTITVTASAGGKTGKIDVVVAGTNLTITGSSTQQLNSTSAYSVRAVDSSGNPLIGVGVSVTSTLGTVSSSSITTDNTGNASFSYTASAAGAGVITVTGAGATKTLAITVSSVSLLFTTPSPNASVDIGANQTVTLRYLDGGTPKSGNAVNFSTTRGTVSTASATTNASGDATITVSSTTAGPATITAQIPGVGSATLALNFVAKAATKITLQATPSAIPPNSAGGATNQSTLTAVVRDAQDNLVAGQVVTFNLQTDLSGGSLSSGTAVTDANGRAQVQFIAGAVSTPANGVVVAAAVSGTAVSTTANLTVSGSALFINIGFGNDIANLDSTTYSKPFAIYVTDANGVPVGNQIVTLSVIPLNYSKGTLTHNGTVWVYSPGSPTATCLNEDANGNGILDSGEDDPPNGNGNKRLTPGNIAVASPGTVTTDATGRALFNLQYGEQFATWSTVTIAARASVAGTESLSSITFPLTGLSDDFSDAAVAPAARISPFGVSSVCTNAN